MQEFVRPVAEWAASILETMGVGVIILFAAYALFVGAYEWLKRVDAESTYRRLRQRLGRGILLGLELLVAADIIHTVAVDLSFSTVGVLAVIVLIRTFLSFTLELEVNGRWPWEKKAGAPE